VTPLDPRRRARLREGRTTGLPAVAVTLAGRGQRSAVGAAVGAVPAIARSDVRLLARVTSLVVTLVLVLVLVTAGRVWFAGRSDDARRSDVLVVLGASQYDGRPQGYLAARLEHALRLYREKVAPVVLTVGGKRPGDRFTEAAAGRDYLVRRRLPSSSVVSVGVGNDTQASLAAAAALMRERGWTSAVVVTDPWHELRSTTMLADAGGGDITVHGSAVTGGPSLAGGGVELRYVVRETAAYLAYEAGRLVP